MKETLRQRIEAVLRRIENEINLLEKHKAQYLDECNYKGAGRCDEQIEPLSWVMKDLKEALN